MLPNEGDEMITIFPGDVECGRAIPRHIPMAQVFHIDHHNAETLWSQPLPISFTQQPNHICPMQLEIQKIRGCDVTGQAAQTAFATLA